MPQPIALLGAGLLLALSATTLGGQVSDQSAFSTRLREPRVAPVGLQERTPEQQQMLASRPDFNIYKTLAHDPELFARWSGLGQYLLNGSSLPARDREIIILRMGWLCQAPYEWSQHARIAKASKLLSDAEIHAIAEGPASGLWSPFERTLLQMVDELRYQAGISDPTWMRLSEHYSIEQRIDALYTAGQYQLVSMALNSLGVQLDPELRELIPTDVKSPTVAGEPHEPRLQIPRLPPLSLQAMSPEQRALVTPQMRDGKVPNLYATLVAHQKLYEPRWRFGSYLLRDSHLPARTREILILRTAWNARTQYEWAHHVPIAKQAGLSDADIARIARGPAAPGWSDEERALIQTADELRREAFVSDATWSQLVQHYDTPRVFEILYTVGGYAMTALAINSLGIQLEPGYPAMPAHAEGISIR
jgi:4-carboxymuconolactone decarboxylase